MDKPYLNYNEQIEKLKSKGLTISNEKYPFLNEGTLASVLREVAICRNSCAHGERLYTFKTREACPKLMLHEKLNIPLNANGNEYTYGQRDLFSVVISFKYLLDSSDFKEFKNSLSKLIKRYQRKSKVEIAIKEMGFPSNWETITKYRKYQDKYRKYRGYKKGKTKINCR